MSDDDDDFEIDFDMNEGQSSKDNEKKGVEKDSELTILNYEEEWKAERRRHEKTKQQLFFQEEEMIKLKARLDKLEQKTEVQSNKGQSTGDCEHSHLQRIANLEEELRFSLGSAEDIRALKSKSINLVERIRQEKQEKARVEAEVRSMAKRMDMLSIHIEKLMIHLKHEAAAKIKAMDSLRGSERRCISLSEKNVLLARKMATTDRLVHELREGSKILEDQLRLMDEKYLELRTKLDFSRDQAARKVEIAEKKATSLRVKYAMLGNSKLLDTVDQPMWESQDIINDPDPATNALQQQQQLQQVIHRGSMKKRAGTATPKVKRIDMTPGFTCTDKDKQEEVVLDKIRRNRGRETIWTKEKLLNLAKTSR